MIRIVWESVKYWIGRGLLYGAGLGTLYVTIGSGNINIAGGVIFGGTFGAAAGLFSGLVDGLLIGLVCYCFFNPVRDPKRFRWIMVIVAAVGTYIGTLFFLLILLPIPFSGQPGELNEHGLSLFQVPALLAVAGAIYAALRFVKNYLSPKVVSATEVPPSVGAVSHNLKG
jgi:hypothetical protein